MDVRARMGKRRESVGENAGPIFNFLSPQHDLLDGYCHVEFLLLLAMQFYRGLTSVAGAIGSNACKKVERRDF
jgi:hypothetical protein